MIAANYSRFVRGLWVVATAVGFTLAGGCGSDTGTDKTSAPITDEAKAQRKADFQKQGLPKAQGATRPAGKR